MLNYAIRKIRKLQNVLDEESLAEKVLNNPGIQTAMIELNQIQMYSKGIDSKGDTLGQYSPFTIQHKIEIGERYDHVTLKDTGEFYDSMKVEVRGEEAYITGDMQKSDTDLEIIYPKALGLNEESLSEIRDMAKEIVRSEVRQSFAA